MNNRHRILSMVSAYSATWGIRQWIRYWQQKSWSDAVAPLCDGLARMLSAGLPIPLALEHLDDRAWGRTRRTAIIQARNAIQQGTPLSAAWAVHGSPLFVTLLEVSERCGRLSEVLGQWAQHVESRRKLTQDIWKLCTYPAVVSLSNSGLLWFVVSVVVPTFQRMTLQFTNQPEVAFSKSLSAGLISGLRYGTMGLLVVAALIFILHRWSDHPDCALPLFIQHRLPGMRLKVLRRTSLFAMLLTILTEAGMPLMDSLTALNTQNGPKWLIREAGRVHGRLLQGAALSQAFVGDWDPLLQRLIAWSEATGDTTAAFSEAHRLCQIDFVRRLHRAIRFAEPVILLLLGLSVLATMAMIFVPLYDQVSMLESSTSFPK